MIDAQKSFHQRPYFSENDLSTYLTAQNALIDGCVARGVLVLHVDESAISGNPFSLASGFVKPLAGLTAFKPPPPFTKAATARWSAPG